METRIRELERQLGRKAQGAGGGGGDPEVGARQVTVKKPTLRVQSLKPDVSQ
jgi:hypothetical protein